MSNWYHYESKEDFSVLKGKTITEIKGKAGDEELNFTTSDGTLWKLVHIQDCYENVYLEDIVGDLEDLLNSEILIAEESTSAIPEPGQDTEDVDSFTWTFYTLRTMKGTVTLRWYGESNGYYSEGVDLINISEWVKK